MEASASQAANPDRGSAMNSADSYRDKAGELETLMRAEKDPVARIQWENMSKAYRRLAELADRNARTHLVYEPPIRSAVQQQQQPQLKLEEDKS
jgi:hypothetical protein